MIDEAETLRKRIDLRELVLIETTCVTSHPAVPFSKALAAAIGTIRAEDDETFSAAVDIRRARAHRITPLGIKSGGLVPGDESQTPLAEQPLEAAPTLPVFDDNALDDAMADTPESRLERWQRKLLDLTLRNPLLNHRAARTSLRIICPEPGRLEDKLAEGLKIRITTVPRPSSQAQDEELHHQREGEKISVEYARDELERKRVLVDLPAEQLSQRAVEIYRKAQTALQEGGSNTLYLAIGFLLWKRDQKDDRRFRAPLILLPVTLERKSVRSGITMAVHDDEPRFNTTLLEMLRRDFQIKIPGLDGELPTDHSGIDVAAIWDTVRSAVREVPGFEVIEDVVLGHFSFAKYLMWKDLVDRIDALRDNAVVRHLIDTPRDPYGEDLDFVEQRQLDRDYKPSDLLTSLPGDSSQTAAIATADRGKDFVIIGPPGTGKSQTISNLIGHLLGKGKTVLFVSEKSAALEVVYRRLSQTGLGRFCLELHSNKARKADVLKQLGAAWESANIELELDWKRKADELLSLRNHINGVVDHLHRKRRNGMKVYDAMGMKILEEEIANRITLSWPTPDHHDEADLKVKREVVDNLSIQAKAAGDVSQSPFNLVDRSQWTPQWEMQIVERSGSLSVAAENLERALEKLCEATGIVLLDSSMTRLDALGQLASLLVDSYRQPTAYALRPDGQDRISDLEEAVKRLKAYAEAQESLSCAYEPFAWRSLDGEGLGLRWSEAEASWSLKRFLGKRGIVKEMRANGAKGRPDPFHDAPKLASLRRDGEALDRLNNRLSDLKNWAGHATDPAVAESLSQLGKRARIATESLADDPQTLLDIREKTRTLLHEGNDLLARDGRVGGGAITFLNALKALRNVCDEFEAIAGVSVRETFAEASGALPQIRQAIDTIRDRHTELNAWCAWRRRRTEAIDADLLPLVEIVEQGRVLPDEIRKTFEAAYCGWWSAAVIEEDDVLRSFSAPEHEASIDKFRQIDDQFRKLTAEYIAAKISGTLPDQGSVTGRSQWGILRRELQKKKRHKPVRKLLEDAPDVLMSLTPCFMMSPLSVAQYLPADQALFDVVIFDEASQITVWDAVGSIARGKQVIVAGDPKQMPPTNFFSRAEDNSDGDIDTEGDLESILDEMLGAGISSRILNLHYRSRRESLIAFSNDRYYDNDLITFPASEVSDSAVRLKRPSGPNAFYARGGARHNQGEARAIVDEIFRRLTHRDPAVRNASIGVVTFNSEQQTLIEDMLDEVRSKHQGIEFAFSGEQVTEPVFVKNLETVQGDERDVILFSVTYGPDQSGHVTMNFGPLNREGGERRLNVAVTRARSEMIVFSVLHPDHIDLSRTQARAVADLKCFLEYAEKGRAALGSAVRGSVADFESPFEAAVARELRMNGWQVHPQVGVSAYRIDLGIVHPDAPGRYLAGIECDGAMYHSSAFARERDKIRQSVLEGLGWTIFRVWSTDWWTNKKGAVKKIDELLRERLEETRLEQAGKEHISALDEDDEKQLAENGLPEATLENVGNAKAKLSHEKDTQEGTGTKAESWSRQDGNPRYSDTVHAITLRPYPEFQGQTGPDPRNADSIQVAEGLCRIIQCEGPMLAKRAYDIYLRGCGIRRMGKGLKSLMNKALQHAIRQELVIKEDEWDSGGLLNSIVRSSETPPVVGRKRGSRSFDEIPPSELQKIAHKLLVGSESEFEYGSDHHLKAVLNAFDLRRLTTSTQERLKNVLDRRYLHVDGALKRMETNP